MHLLASLAVAQSLLQGVQAPVLEFPEPGLDDPAAYGGYVTRFFRDSHRNTFQVYLDARHGRVVHLWADAANASAAFTVRDTAGGPAPLAWGTPGATAGSDGAVRSMRHALTSDLGAIEIGWFVLGTMRQERDFQYAGRHRAPYGDSAFVLAELTDLVRGLERLPAGERARHLALLHAGSVDALRGRLEPRVTLSENDSAWVVLVEQVSLDGRNRMTLRLAGDARASAATVTGGVVSLRARSATGLRFDVIVTTDAGTLTPLDREEIFNDAFDAFYARQRTAYDSLRGAPPSARQGRDARLASFRRLEREVRALELLSSSEKLMAGLPNFATYFGRDMMMAALMLEPVLSVDLQEHVIASVLRKLAPTGDVSHEEALGGQAIREAAAEYAASIRAWEEARHGDSATAATRLAGARALLERPAAVRENYRMIDDDFQLPVLVARYLSRADVPQARKRAFLGEAASDGSTRLDALVRNLALVARRARPYAERPQAANLVEFLHRDDEGWLPGSWRDSRAGYGNGRFAMDVNVVWVPQALEATEAILRALRTLDPGLNDALTRVPDGTDALATYARDSTALRAATATWRGARRHFEVRFEADALRRRVGDALATLPDGERAYWRRRLDGESDRRPLRFLALALDGAGRPVPAANTDVATDLFLEDYTERVLRGEADASAVVQQLDVVTRPYPVGLLVPGLGPVVVNDVLADSAVRRRFREDRYHSPRVVWGREVNLLLLGLARQIAAAYDAAGRPRSRDDAVRSYVQALRRALETTRRAVEASGLRHNELWSYRIEGDTLRPVRYGTSSDIQLWNVTDLAVRFALDRLPPP